MSLSDFYWLAPLVPLAAFTALVLGLSRFDRVAIGLAIGSVAVSLVVSCAGLLGAASGMRDVAAAPWLVTGGLRLELALGVDPLGATIATVVSFVCVVVFAYSVRYMAGDPHRGRFFTYLSLFAGSMLALVLAADILTFFIAWELVGLCSYLLIGFWRERPGVPRAATQAFVTTRLGDLAMLLGVLLLLTAAGTSRIEDIPAAPAAAPTLVAVVLIFAGAVGKSAQVPLQGWLPDAMVGPTPVSALLHSATMVAAGVFLIARLYPLFQAAAPALDIVAWVGAVTAIVGGAAALVQKDLKRTLAYSTMSQLGLMFIGLGAGSLVAGIGLLIAQALYKSLLFLTAGAVDHAVQGTGFEHAGGLARRMPLTFVVFLIGAVPLAGFPVTLALPLKDSALAAAATTGTALFVAALIASLLTAAYTARMLALVFFGPASARARDAREAPRGLWIPAALIAVVIPWALAIDAGWLGHPLAALLGSEAPSAPWVTGVALAAAALGTAIGLGACRTWPTAIVWPPLVPVAGILEREVGLRPAYRAAAPAALTIVHRVGTFDRRVFDAAAGKMAHAFLKVIRAAAGFDRRLFDAAGGKMARAFLKIVRGTAGFDQRVFDTAARAATTGMLLLVRGAARLDLQGLDGLIRSFSRDVLAAGERIRAVQTGRIEQYLLGAFGWVLLVLAAAAIAALV